MKESTCFHIGAGGTHVVKSKRGILNLITINTTANGAITVYDGTDDTGKVLATIKASIAEQTLMYGVRFLNGLTIKTAANSDISVCFE